MIADEALKVFKILDKNDIPLTNSLLGSYLIAFNTKHTIKDYNMPATIEVLSSCMDDKKPKVRVNANNLLNKMLSNCKPSEKVLVMTEMKKHLPDKHLKKFKTAFLIA